MKDWYKLIDEAKTQSEQRGLFLDMFYEITSVDPIEDEINHDEYIDGMVKIISVLPDLMVKEFEEVGITVTTDEIIALSVEKKRYLVEGMDNLKEAWETIKMLST